MSKRVHIEVRGAVQGVGFRPFIYRLAGEHRLAGWVMNASAGVIIEAEGEDPEVDRFVLRIEAEKPARAFIQSFEFTFLDRGGYQGFTIRESDGAGELSVFVMPDIAACPACLAEIADPTNRRYGYPFTNCTNCGPRFTIITALPYDRPNTSMNAFVMCDECRREYEDPGNRRFHAQPNACPVCGPHVELWTPGGDPVASRGDAIDAAVAALLEGKTIAVKGLGGFHLMVDATNEAAVAGLRERKRREEKPLAIMVQDVSTARMSCVVSPLEERLLRSPESPIVLLKKIGNAGSSADVARNVAPGNPTLGVMLPYTPLHHLLLRKVGRPLVATSGNLTDEPICTDEREALYRLAGIADLFLVHNRPIVRFVDDSVVRVLMDRELVLRRSRGYAPLPVSVSTQLPDAIAVGAHLKNTVAVARRNSVFISQHLGDLETEQSLIAFRSTLKDFQRLYQLAPSVVVADKHPDYISTEEALGLGLPVRRVQHHHAHIAACMAENGLSDDVLGVSWDGSGWGLDGTIWGGEFLVVGKAGFRRVASIRSFDLPGGDAAAREPRRSALGMVREIPAGDQAGCADLACFKDWDTEELQLVQRAIQRRINVTRTTSAGRLFDGVASLLGLRQKVSFEGQAAMELEWLAHSAASSISLPMPVVGKTEGERNTSSLLVVDWVPCVQHILGALRRGSPPAAIAHGFHRSLAGAIVDVAKATGLERIVLSGGCFQNVLLTSMTVGLLKENGFSPYWHQRVPPNDGGISLGQIYATLVLQKEE
ncbi:MAG TPA: carbamoyltransferase HypF [Bacteroidota bacterium]|nr:carbamoyltransferase HypF [Bacteroidota bacterium]